MKNLLYATLLPAQRHFRELLTALQRAFELQAVPPARGRRTYYDTFDWRLYTAGLALEVDAGEPGVARLRGHGMPSETTEAPAPDLQRPVRNWPRGPLRNALLSVVGVRALLPLGTVQLKITPYKVLDRRGKVLAWIEKEQLLEEPALGRGRTVLTGVRIRPLRGFEKAGRKILACLPHPDALEDPSADLYFHHLRFLGRRPDPGRRPTLNIRPGMGAREVLCRILLAELNVMERNLDGVMQDIDTEFLHDFRIAGRRSRSLYTEFQRVFAAGDGARFRDDLAWLSKATCGQRDLDVMLLMLDDREAAHPGASPGLQLLRGIIEARRIRAHEGLTAALGLARLGEFFSDWRHFLDAGAEPGALPHADLAAKTGQSIRRVLQKFVRDAQRLETGVYSEALHDLRKTGKKLRYLLESFRELYAEVELKRVIRQLRKLQNSLGDIVDAHTQREFVRLCLRELPEATCGEMENRDLQRLAQGFVQRGVDAGTVLRARLRELTAQQNLDRLTKLFTAGP